MFERGLGPRDRGRNRKPPLRGKAMKEAVVERRIEDLADIRLVIANGETHVNRLAERRPS